MQSPTWSERPTENGTYGDPLVTPADQPTTAQLEGVQDGSPGWNGRHVCDAVMTSDKAWSGPALDTLHYAGSPAPQYGGPPGRGRMPEHSLNSRQHETLPGNRIQQPGACHGDNCPGTAFADHQGQVHPSSPRAPTTRDIFSSDVGEYRVPPPPPPPKRLHGPLSPSSICKENVGYGPQPPQSPSSNRVGNRIPPPTLQPSALSLPHQPLSPSGQTGWNGMSGHSWY